MDNSNERQGTYLYIPHREGEVAYDTARLIADVAIPVQYVIEKLSRSVWASWCEYTGWAALLRD